MKIGFIGAGNMASAIAAGVVNNGYSQADDIYMYDIATEKLTEFTGNLGAHAVHDPQELIQTVDTLVIAVKPNVIKSVLLEAKAAILKNDPLVVSIAAGTTTDAIYETFATDQPIRIIRVMPNVNAMIGEGAAAVCGNQFAKKEDIDTIVAMFNAIGKAWPLDESHFSNFTAIAGSAPAYAYLFIDSLARAGVKNGLPKNVALEIAAQTVLGSAKTLQETGENPWEWIDRVSSPGGTTVAGLVELENNAFIATVIKGIDAAIQRDKELGE